MLVFFSAPQLKRLRYERDCVRKIVVVLRKRIYRRRYLRLRQAAQMLQKRIRRFLFWRRILRYRRQMLRPVEVRLHSVEGLTSPYGANPEPYIANPFVVMTVSHAS